MYVYQIHLNKVFDRVRIKDAKHLLYDQELQLDPIGTK